MLSVSGRISTNTLTPPRNTKGLAVETKVYDGMMTSSPGWISARSAAMRFGSPARNHPSVIQEAPRQDLPFRLQAAAWPAVQYLQEKATFHYLQNIPITTTGKMGGRNLA